MAWAAFVPQSVLFGSTYSLVSSNWKCNMGRAVYGLTLVGLCLLLTLLASKSRASVLADCPSTNIEKASWAVNGIISSIEWAKYPNGSATKIGFILLSDGTVWRTLDGGKSVSSVQTQLNNDYIRAIYQTWEGSKLFFITKKTWMWTTEDQGATFVNATVPYYIHDMQLHPSEPSRILATALTPCCQESLACTKCKALLLVSGDMGVNWSNLTDYLYYRGKLAYAWAPVLSSTIDRGVAYIHYTDKEGDQRVKLGESMNLVLLSDFTNSSSVLSNVANGGPLSISDNAYMMARVATGRPGLSIIEVSRDYGKNFTTVEFPPLSSFDSLREWLATESGNPFLGVFNGRDYTYGNVYVSTGGLNDFTIALRGLIRRHGTAHWAHLGSDIPGTYFANAYLTNDALTVGTFVTHNHGGHWEKLLLERDDKRKRSSHGVNDNKDDDDDDDDDDDNRIHLAAPFYGSPKFQAPLHPPGLIVAAGQVGSKLTDWNGNTVLISRDAGRTWAQTLLQGSFVIHAVNGGSLIFAASDSTYNESLYYSLDFGKTWSTYCFTEGAKMKAIQFTSTEAQDLSTIVYLDAQFEDGSYTLFMFETINMWPRTCTLDDFKTWQLEDVDGHNCVFGMSNIYLRRDANAQCLKLPGQARLFSSVKCECTEQDFVCPFCYARNDDGDCDYLWSDCTADRPIAPGNCSEEWEDPMNAAYVKLPETQCVGGWTLDNFHSVLSCPPPPTINSVPPPYSTLQGSIGVTIGAIAIALCGILIVGLYYGCRNLIAGTPPIDFNAWRSAQQPTTDGDQIREKVHRDLEYQSDLESTRGDTPVPLEPLDDNYDTIELEERYDTLH